MTQIYNGRPELDYFVAIAQAQRAEAMTRTAHILIDGIERGLKSFLGGISRGSRVLAGAVAARRRRRAMLRALQGLDDRLLRDIGLTRADVWAVAGGEQPVVRGEDLGPAGPPSIDVALSDVEIHSCNDNGSPRRAA